ncbi:MAG: hypothetical protein JRI69_12050 [Deltaproteobacteria bacterium]|nr:hypothetical protein [Deltaproteobacteria bacterium]
MKRYRIIFTFFLLVSWFLTTTHAYEIPKKGHDWQSLPKSEKVAFCSALILEKEGLGVHTSETVELAAKYFAGRINYYYETHSLNDPMSEAEAWAYPETKKMLDGLSSKDKKTVKDDKTTQKKSVAEPKKYPTGIGSIKLGDSKRTVYNKIRKSKNINLPDYCKSPSFNE